MPDLSNVPATRRRLGLAVATILAVVTGGLSLVNGRRVTLAAKVKRTTAATRLGRTTAARG